MIEAGGGRPRQDPMPPYQRSHSPSDNKSHAGQSFVNRDLRSFQDAEVTAAPWHTRHGGQKSQHGNRKHRANVKAAQLTVRRVKGWNRLDLRVPQPLVKCEKSPTPEADQE